MMMKSAAPWSFGSSEITYGAGMATSLAARTPCPPPPLVHEDTKVRLSLRVVECINVVKENGIPNNSTLI